MWWWCGRGEDAREASEKRKKTKKKKKKKREKGRKMREVYFPPFLVPAVFLFHDGLVGSFPCSVRSGESCGGSGGGGGGGGGGVSGAHVKTEGERVGKVARMIGELEEQSAWTHWTCASRLSLSLSLSLSFLALSPTHPHSVPPPLLHLTLFPFPCLPSLTCCNAESRGCSLLIRLGRGSCKEKPPAQKKKRIRVRVRACLRTLLRGPPPRECA